MCTLLCEATKESTNELDDKKDIEHQEFYDACARGELDIVKKHLSHNPELVTASTLDGETCLHLTAVSRSLDIAKLVVTKGANTNHRVTHDQGLRMTPLSWHAWGGNVEIIELLLDNGADINADVDFSPESDRKITAIDIVELVGGHSSKMEDDSENSDMKKFHLSHDLLRSRGGKAFKEL